MIFTQRSVGFGRIWYCDGLSGLPASNFWGNFRNVEIIYLYWVWIKRPNIVNNRLSARSLLWCRIPLVSRLVTIHVAPPLIECIRLLHPHLDYVRRVGRVVSCCILNNSTPEQYMPIFFLLKIYIPDISSIGCFTAKLNFVCFYGLKFPMPQEWWIFCQAE